VFIYSAFKINVVRNNNIKSNLFIIYLLVILILVYNKVFKIAREEERGTTTNSRTMRNRHQTPDIRLQPKREKKNITNFTKRGE
jgi:transposase